MSFLKTFLFLSAKPRKVTIRSAICMEHNIRGTNFREILYLEVLQKPVEKIQVWLKIVKK